MVCCGLSGGGGVLGVGVEDGCLDVGLAFAEVGAGGALCADGLGAVGEGGVLGEPEGLTWEDAEKKRREAGDGKADAGGDRDGAQRGEAGVVEGGPAVEGGEQAEVVEAGDAGVEQADDGEPDVAGVRWRRRRRRTCRRSRR